MTSNPLQRAGAAIERGAFAEAAAICESALARNPDDAEALFLLGSALARSGDAKAAAAPLERARALAPRNVLVLNALGGVYAANGREEDALAVLQAAYRIDPGFPWMLQNLGSVLKSFGDLARARQCFEAALAKIPSLAEAMAGLADIALLENREDVAGRLCAQALSVAPGLPAARLVALKLAFNRGGYDHAVDESARMLAQTHDTGGRAALLFLRAQALEKLGRHAEAFATFASVNDLLRETHRAKFENAPGITALATIARITDFVASADAAAWRPVANPGRTPAFLVGFPRSGTTLLDQVLASHPDIETLEESQNFAEAFQPLILEQAGFDRWAALTEGEVGAFRDAYWKRAETALGHAPSRKLFIDKLPLNTILLPLIHRLFPEASIIFALRDPRDVVLSCFTQRFTMSAAMYQLLSLDSAARFYDAVMALGLAARERLPLDLHVVRYEALVADFDGTVAELLAFLGLPWDARVRDYVETANARLIRTPSAKGVRTPLYGASIGRWRRHENELAPILPALEKWVLRFGYE